MTLLDELFPDAAAEKDACLLHDQAALLRECRLALEKLLYVKPQLGAFDYGVDTLGNLRAKLYDYRRDGVFGGGHDKE